jgi:hypothetical protein
MRVPIVPRGTIGAKKQKLYIPRGTIHTHIPYANRKRKH